MNSVVFTYALPALLAYSLFVGISGRLNPLDWSADKDTRISSLLGLWVGVCSGYVASLIMQESLTGGQIAPVVISGSVLLASLIVPALGIHAAHKYYRYQVKAKHPAPNFDWAMSEDDLARASEFNADTVEEHPIDAVIEDTTQQFDTLPDVTPAYLESAQIDQLNEGNRGEAVNDETDLGRIAETETGESDSESTLVNDVITEPGQAEMEEANSQPGQHAYHEELHASLAAEVALRKETENHLRITRKALSVLESDTRNKSIDKADTVIELEEKLAQSIQEAAAFETNASEEKGKRLDVEHNLVELKQNLVRAKQEIRKSAAARAEALSTANKSIAFARQSVQIRARLESELNEANDTIKNRQKTISSLIRALEKEKRRTQNEVASMAKQLVIQEKQVNARRSRERMARNVENKLTSRLVKKVAKARPLLSDGVNRGEAN